MTWLIKKIHGDKKLLPHTSTTDVLLERKNKMHKRKNAQNWKPCNESKNYHKKITANNVNYVLM